MESCVLSPSDAFLPPSLRPIHRKRRSTSEHAAPGATAGANAACTPRGTAPSVRCGFVTRESRAQTATCPGMPNMSLNCNKCNLYFMIMLLSIYGSFQILPLYGFATLIYTFLGQRAYQLNTQAINIIYTATVSSYAIKLDMQYLPELTCSDLNSRAAVHDRVRYHSRAPRSLLSLVASS